MVVKHPPKSVAHAKGTRYQVTYIDCETGKEYTNDVVYDYASVAHTEAMSAIDSVLIACPGARVRYEVKPIRAN